MRDIPKEKGIEHSLDVLRDGYRFILNRYLRFGSEKFQTRIMLRPTTCIHGTEAARLFYDESKMRRHGAMPQLVQRTLTGRHTLHGMDDAPHRDRKQTFLSLLTPAAVAEISELMTAEWRQAIKLWTTQETVTLFTATQDMLCRAVCRWAGIPLSKTAAPAIARDCAAMIDAFGAVGRRHWRGYFARRRTEQWARTLIRRVRRGQLLPPLDSALYAMATHCDLAGRRWSVQTAAVELINVIRPTVAVSYYIAFAALALHEHPDCGARLCAEAADYATMFVHEIRRFYPFAPYLGAITREKFTWRGCPFAKNHLVLLDIYGTHHDPQLWPEPAAFNPERFRHRKLDANDFLPQGGGMPLGHRCPGETLTIALLQQAVQILACDITYELPRQDLDFSLQRMPTYPRSGIVLRQVKRR